MAAGHEPIHERQTFRHRLFKKNLKPDHQVRLANGEPLVSHGHNVVVGDMLPERADLCLDEDGRLVSQGEFDDRYMEMLKWYDLVEGSDPKAEYIPNVKAYALKVPDRFSESPGMVDIGYDARKPAPDVEKTHYYDAKNDEMVEIMKEQGAALETTLEAVRNLLEESKNKRGPGRPRKDAA